MPVKREWTEEMSAQVVALRAEGLGWATISKRLHVSYGSLMEHASSVLKLSTGHIDRQKQSPNVPYESRNAEPLKAGHATSMAVLMALTPSLNV